MQREGVYLLSTTGVGLRFTYGTCSLSVLGVLHFTFHFIPNLQI